jgi:hypothetical protein
MRRITRWLWPIALVCLMGADDGTCLSTSQSAAKATRNADEYATHIKGASSTSCTAKDTDGDGYCSCTVFRENGDKPMEPLSIQCACSASDNEGCKLTPVTVRR